MPTKRYPKHPLDPNDPDYDPKLDPHNSQYNPNDPRLIGGAYDRHPDLMEGAPEDVTPAPSEIAGETVTPSAGPDKHADLMEDAPLPAKVTSMSSANPEEKGDFSGLFGEMGPQIRAHPYIAGGIAGAAAIPLLMGGGAVAGGLGALMRAYPLASQILAASAAGGAAQTGIPQEAVHSLLRLVHMGGE